MTDVHSYLGLALAGLFLIIFLWGLIAWIANKHPPNVFWKVVAGGQVGLLLFALTGIVMFAIRRPSLTIDRILHFAYGAFPLLVIYYSHRFARKAQDLAWAAFAVGGLVIFGLLVRGYMTG